MKDGVCPKCDSRDIVGNITECVGCAYGKWFYGVRIDRGFLNKKEVAAGIAAWICGACGYTEFYASNAQAISQAVDESLSQTPGRRRSSLDPIPPIRVSPAPKNA